jgi:hypothetical protein
MILERQMLAKQIQEKNVKVVATKEPMPEKENTKKTGKTKKTKKS